MAFEVVMPKLGWTMEEGIMGEWLKADGDTVAAGDILFTVESDKATNEVESFEEGILRIPPDSPATGETVPVGALLAYIIAPGEAAPFEQPATATQPATPGQTSTAPPSVPASTSSTIAPRQRTSSRTRIAISPRARRVARELGIDWQQLYGSQLPGSQPQGSGKTGRIIERDIRAAAKTAPSSAAAHTPAPDSQAEIRISPVARRMAERLGVDLNALAATAPDRRITREDVEQAVSQSLAQPTAQSAAQPIAQPASTRRPITQTRRVIAQRMAESTQTTAPVTLNTEVDATRLHRLRAELKAQADQLGGPVPSFNDMLTKLTAVALVEFPALNATMINGGQDEIIEHGAVHMGLAADTERGLLVPVVRDVQAKSLQQIAVESAELLARARAGTAATADLQGSTFTITNLGMYGIDAFTPIINLPECAILGIGRIVSKVVVIDEATEATTEATAVRKRMTVSLTFDHRVVDGAPAARFLQRVGQFIENPTLWLIR